MRFFLTLCALAFPTLSLAMVPQTSAVNTNGQIDPVGPYIVDGEGYWECNLTRIFGFCALSLSGSEQHDAEGNWIGTIVASDPRAPGIPLVTVARDLATVRLSNATYVLDISPPIVAAYHLLLQRQRPSGVLWDLILQLKK